MSNSQSSAVFLSTAVQTGAVVSGGEAMADDFQLERFVAAQARNFDDALAELRRGRKTSHWMWFVFPQVAGLGRSPTARFRLIYLSN